MIKFRLYFDKDAEVKWLNEMAANGWAMEHFFAGFYSFDKCAYGKYTYQIDIGNSFFSVNDEYREIMRDAGIEIVQIWGFWIVLRRLASEGNFELYTDIESSIEHYSKIRKLFKIVTVIELILLWIELMITMIEQNPYGIPFIFLLSTFVIVLARMAIITTNKINDLKEKQTGIAEKRRRNISLLIAAGCFLNFCSLVINVSIHTKDALQIFATVLIIAGCYRTCIKEKM